MAARSTSTIWATIISAASAVVIALITTYGTIVVSAPEAKQVKNELAQISDLQKVANLPIGTIAPSMLSPGLFAEAVGDPSVFDPKVSKWVLADGQHKVAVSRYGILRGRKEDIPDLRGMFLRGLSEGRHDGDEDPEPNRTAGSYQPDALQKHRHETNARAHGWVREKPGAQGWTTRGAEAPQAGVMEVLEARVAGETRPKNVAVYLYIKIN